MILEIKHLFQPEMTPLFSPGMPCTKVTLLFTKYSSQVALSSGPLQKSDHSWVVTVMLSTMSVFRHVSKSWFCRVRFPNMQTLCGGQRDTGWTSSNETLISVSSVQLLFNEAEHRHMDRAHCKPDSREVWWLKDGLDDSSVDGEDGQDDTGQED